MTNKHLKLEISKTDLFIPHVTLTAEFSGHVTLFSEMFPFVLHMPLNF